MLIFPQNNLEGKFSVWSDSISFPKMIISFYSLTGYLYSNIGYDIDLKPISKRTFTILRNSFQILVLHIQITLLRLQLLSQLNVSINIYVILEVFSLNSLAFNDLPRQNFKRFYPHLRKIHSLEKEPLLKQILSRHIITSKEEKMSVFLPIHITYHIIMRRN